MTISRYSNQIPGILNNERYKEMLRKRGIQHAHIFPQPQLRYPTAKEITQLTLISHIWRDGDRYWRLAAKYYKRSQLWWVIAWFNQKPTEAHVIIGDVIYIPTPLEKTLDIIGA